MSDNELVITRYIDAPPEKVWDAMTRRQEEWWCPRPWRAEFDVNERRAGGRNEVTMHGPEGEVHTHGGIYLAYDEGRRFVSTDAVRGDFEPAEPFMLGIWEIEPEGAGTRYTARARHWTEEAKKRHEEMGFADGLGHLRRPAQGAVRGTHCGGVKVAPGPAMPFALTSLADCARFASWTGKQSFSG